MKALGWTVWSGSTRQINKHLAETGDKNFQCGV